MNMIIFAQPCNFTMLSDQYALLKEPVAVFSPYVFFSKNASITKLIERLSFISMFRIWALRQDSK